MGIFSRTRDIFAANMTELLDRSEDPARMIRMIILEMEETLVEVRASAARSIADGKEMRRACARLDELQASWTDKAELALSKDREDWAKAREMLNGGRTEDAFSRFEILERRADFAEGRADALGMTGPKSLEEEIAELKAAEKVDAELEAMKAARNAQAAAKGE